MFEEWGQDTPAYESCYTKQLWSVQTRKSDSYAKNHHTYQVFDVVCSHPLSFFARKNHNQLQPLNFNASFLEELQSGKPV